MKKRLVTLFAVVCALALVLSTIGSVAFAGTNVNNVAPEGLMNAAGTGINSTYFSINGDSDPSAYTFKKGNTSAYVNASNNTLVFREAIAKSDLKEDSVVTYQFDMTAWAGGGQLKFMPFADNYGAEVHSDGATMYAMNLFYQWTGRINVNNNLNKNVMKAYDGAGNEIAFNGAIPGFVTTGYLPWDEAAFNAFCADNAVEYVTYWVECDMNGTMTFNYGYDPHDGSAITKIKGMEIRDAYEVKDYANYYFGNLISWGALQIDNYTVYEKHMDGEEAVVKSLGYCDFEDFTAIDTTGAAASGLAFLGATPVSSATRIAVTNPVADSRIVSLSQLVIDEDIAEAFELNTKIKLNNIAEGVKVGYAFGLANALALPSDGCSFIYLTKKGDALYLGAQAEGEMVGEEVALTVNTADYINVKIFGKTNGEAVVTIADAEPVTFAGLKLAGRFAITQLGEGALSYELDPEIKLLGYTFDASEGGTLAQNFNTGYINSNNYTLINNNAKNIPEGAESMGVYADDTDGTLFFNGSGTHSRIMFNEKYSDFVMQVDFTSVPLAQRTGTTTGRYAPMSLLFGIPEIDMTWSNGYICSLYEGHGGTFYGATSLFICDQGSKWNKGTFNTGFASTKVLATGTPAPEGTPEEDIISYNIGGTMTDCVETPSAGLFQVYNRTTRLKLVVVNNKVGIYMAPIAEDGTVGDYVTIVMAEVPKAEGFVGIATDDPGFFKIDNLCITPISDQAKALGKDCTVDQVVYTDVNVADIADEQPPMPIAKPVVTLTENTLTWEPVEFASKYIVSIQVGLEAPENIEVTECTYEFDKTAAGEYRITVQAITEDEDKLNSLKSDAVIITVEEAANRTPICASSVSFGFIALTALAAAVYVSKKR